MLVKAVSRQVSVWTSDELKTVKLDTSLLDGKVAVITLSRPEARNAWNEFMRNEIARCLDEVSKMKKVRAVIITGDPAGKWFSRCGNHW